MRRFLIFTLILVQLLGGCTSSEPYEDDTLQEQSGDDDESGGTGGSDGESGESSGDEQGDDEAEGQEGVKSGVRAIVIAEGQFGYSTGSMMSLGHDGALSYDLFRTANGRGLGDVPQSMTRIGDNYYIAINNGNCIEVINCDDYRSVETMRLPYSCIPMFIVDMGDGRVAMSDQTIPSRYGATFSTIALLDIDHTKPEREVLISTVEMPCESFEMKRVGDKLFVNCAEFSLFDIDDVTTEGRRVVEHNGSTLSTISKLMEDAQGRLWVMSAKRLYCIDAETESVVSTLDIEALGCSYCDIDVQGRYIYLANEVQFDHRGFGTEIYQVDTEQPEVPTEAIVVHDQGDYWTTYGVQLSRESTLFVIRVLYGSITRARIYEYDLSGEIVSYYDDFYDVPQPYFSAGVFSSFIYFVE